MNEPTPLPRGYSAAGVHCGLKKNDDLDLGLIVAQEAWPASVLFPRNQLLGAHVQVCREHLARSMNMVRAILVNSGNANCANGDAGIDAAKTVSKQLAEILDCPVEQVLFVSTGAIGAPLPTEPIITALPALVEKLSPDGLEEFAHAIMTTDTVPKLANILGEDVEGTPFHITGVAKGSGMIHPDLATMLAFVMTDGRSTKDMNFLSRAVAEVSYNRLTIDGDQSPNDTVVIWHNENQWFRSSMDDDGIETDPFNEALTKTCQDLCRKIAADGEGATRLVTVQVRGASSEREATHVGRTIATSPLVKTAINGRDPNWGRILSAAGRSGIIFDPGQAKVWIGDADLYSHGRGHPDNEPIAHQHLEENNEVIIGMDLGLGPYEADIWSCDMSADYVKINADYRT